MPALVAVAVTLFQGVPALATITVTPLRHTGQYLDNVSGTNFYFPSGTPTAPAFLDVDTGSDVNNPTATVDAPLNLTSGRFTNDGTRNQAMYFLVTTNVPIPSASTGNRTAVIVTTSGQGNGSAKLVPIAYRAVGDISAGSATLCDDTYCFGSVIPTGSLATIYTAADINVGYSSATATGGSNGVIVGIYPRDVCAYYSAPGGGGGGTANGCDPATGFPVANGSYSTLANPMQLTFGIYNVPLNGAASGPTNTPVTTTAVDTAVTETIYFSGATPSVTCPSPLPSDIYFPGDSQIKVRTDYFAGFLTPGTSPSPAPSPTPLATPYAPPPSRVVVVGAPSGTAPDVSQNYATSGTNTIGPSKIGIGNNGAFISGFTNTDDIGNPHAYSLSFLVRDKAGFVASSASCRLDGVETSTIQGFIRQGNCFVATAAFRSVDAAPVELLREFRSEFLMRFGLGRAFVRAYYAHSEPAAEWLMEHPAFRAPVLLALMPLEALAWLVLHPGPLTLLALANAVAVAVALRPRGDRTTEAKA